MSLPFVGRKREMTRLRQWHRLQRHVLVLGPAGVGKSGLVAHLCGELPLIVCGQSKTLGEICRNLEAELHPSAVSAPLRERKNRLLRILTDTGRTVVFDGVGWTTPKISSFLENVMARAPVWICARSELARDIGHFWPLLARFEKIELSPLHFSETCGLLTAAVEAGLIPGTAASFARRWHQLAGGLPLALCELLEQFGAGHRDLSRRVGWRRLKLDRQIKHLFPLFP